ncbi:MAG: ABC transporter permease subunit [Nocardioidaceae bacterium]
MSTEIVPPQRLEFPNAGTSLRRVIRSEWSKFWSVRSTFWTLLTAFTVTVGASTLIAWGASSSLDEMSPSDRATLDVTSTAMVGFAFGQLAMVVLGALVVSSEYGTGGIKATFTAVPARMKVLIAKGVVFWSVALMTGIITAFVAFYCSMLFWKHYGLAAHLEDPGVLRAVIGGGLLVAGSGMFGFALAVILRHTAGAITTAVGLLFIAPLILTPLLPGSWGDKFDTYLTVNAGHHITDVVMQPDQLAPWPGYLWFTLQWVVLLPIGAYLLQRRDA